jgi:surfactin synthase thioesterase subunit
MDDFSGGFPMRATRIGARLCRAASEVGFQVARIMQDSREHPVAVCGVPALGALPAFVVARTFDNLGLWQIFDSCDAFGTIG